MKKKHKMCISSFSGPKVTALECLEAMASGLYSELFTLVISLINRLAVSIYLKFYYYSIHIQFGII